MGVIIRVSRLMARFRVDSRLMKRQCEGLLHCAGFSGWSLDVLLTGDATLRKINAKHRGIDKPTDVLSFPFHENFKRGKVGVDLLISLHFWTHAPLAL